MYALIIAASLGAPIPSEYTVTNRVPGFVVTNRTFVVIPLPVPDLDKPAPPGFQWQRWPGEEGKLVKLAATSGVVHSPFAPESASTPGTGVTNVAGRLPQSLDPAQLRGHIGIGAPAGTSGFIRACDSLG